MDLEQLPPLPAGVHETAAIVIRGYLNPDGTQGYNLACGGSDSLAEYLGLLALAQRDLFNKPA